MHSETNHFFNEDFFKELDFKGLKKTYLGLSFKMLLIRKAEEKISLNVESGVIKCPCHLAIGQEAIPSAISEILKENDKVFEHIDLMVIFYH